MKTFKHLSTEELFDGVQIPLQGDAPDYCVPNQRNVGTFCLDGNPRLLARRGSWILTRRETGTRQIMSPRDLGRNYYEVESDGAPPARKKKASKKRRPGQVSLVSRIGETPEEETPTAEE